MFFLLPYATDRPRQRIPWAVYSLVALNVAVFLASQVDGEGKALRYGLRFTAFEPWDWLTFQFLHGSLLHLLGNMYFLYLFGPGVEDLLGPWVFLGFYLASGIASGLLQGLMTALFFPAQLDIPMIGASGSVAGVLGLYALRLYRTSISVFYFVWLFIVFLRTGTFRVPAWLGLGCWGGQQLLGGIVDMLRGGGGVAHWAHLGGFGLGMLFALAARLRAPEIDAYTLEDAQKAASQGAWERVRRLLRPYVRYYPDHAEALLLLGEALFHLERRQEAVPFLFRAWKEAMKTHQEDLAWTAYQRLKALDSPVLTSEMHLRMARQRETTAPPEEALRLYQDLVQRYPCSPEAELALLRVGLLLWQRMGQPEAALRVFRLLRQRYPHSEWVPWAQRWEQEILQTLS